MPSISTRICPVFFVHSGGTQGPLSAEKLNGTKSSTMPQTDAVRPSISEPNIKKINSKNAEHASSTTCARSGSQTKGRRGNVFKIILSLSAITQTSAMPLSRLEQEGFFPALLESTSPLRKAYVRGAELPPSFSALQPLLNIGDLVYSSNACNVPGCKILYDSL